MNTPTKPELLPDVMALVHAMPGTPRSSRSTKAISLTVWNVPMLVIDWNGAQPSRRSPCRAFRYSAFVVSVGTTSSTNWADDAENARPIAPADGSDGTTPPQ